MDDERKVVGLEGDYNIFKKTDSRDAFENWLTSQRLDQFGKPAARLLNLSFHEIEGNEVCRVVAEPSPTAVFVNERDGKPEKMYIREGDHRVFAPPLARNIIGNTEGRKKCFTKITLMLTTQCRLPWQTPRTPWRL
ncbi:MAG: hypothetical protein M3Y27_11620 [Acidobacteriota bacterium]|nr:hypothetical protein [Acidobacteriota bacterium]